MNDIPEIKTLAATKTWGRGRVYDSIAETIGHTPLVRLIENHGRGQSSGRYPAEARILQSAVVGQGSHRRRDDRRA